MSNTSPSVEVTPRRMALCYVRQSFTQVEIPQHSPERQKANILARCQERGWTPLWFEDAEGHRSGYGEAQRPDWRRLQEWLPNPQVVAVVANEPSRVYRQMWRMGSLMETLDRYGVQFVFASPTSPVRDISQPADRFLLQMVALMDEHLVHDLSRRQKDSIARRRQLGKTTGRPPFGTVRNAEGYLILSSQGVWVFPVGRARAGQVGDVPPAEPAMWRGYAACALRVLTVYAEGKTGRGQIAKQLNGEGWRFRTRKGQPRRLTDDDIRRIVANWPEYGGLVGEKRAKDRPACPPEALAAAFRSERAVFPLELLTRVAEVAAQRRQERHGGGRPSNTDPLALAGLCYCAHCDAQTNAESGEPHRTRLGSLDGMTYRHPSSAPCNTHTHSLPAERLEAEVGHLIDALCLSNERLTDLKQSMKQPTPNLALPDEQAQRTALACVGSFRHPFEKFESERWVGITCIGYLTHPFGFTQ